MLLIEVASFVDLAGSNNLDSGDGLVRIIVRAVSREHAQCHVNILSYVLIHHRLTGGVPEEQAYLSWLPY